MKHNDWTHHLPFPTGLESLNEAAGTLRLRPTFALPCDAMRGCNCHTEVSVEATLQAENKLIGKILRKNASTEMYV